MRQLMRVVMKGVQMMIKCCNYRLCAAGGERVVNRSDERVSLHAYQGSAVMSPGGDSPSRRSVGTGLPPLPQAIKRVRYTIVKRLKSVLTLVFACLFGAMLASAQDIRGTVKDTTG